MLRAGRVNVVALMAVVAIGLLAFVVIFSKESLDSVGARFMTALAKHDVDTLTKMTYLEGQTPEQIRKQWDYAVNDAGKHYIFGWRVLSSSETGDSGAIRLHVWRNANSPSTYEEIFQLPMVKKGEEWKVDVRGISREMFPALPR